MLSKVSVRPRHVLRFRRPRSWWDLFLDDGHRCCELNVMVDGSNAAPSEPPASGSAGWIAVDRAQNHHRRFRRRHRAITRHGVGGKKNVILVVEREAVAAADVRTESAPSPHGL